MKIEIDSEKLGERSKALIQKVAAQHPGMTDSEAVVLIVKQAAEQTVDLSEDEESQFWQMIGEN